MTQKIYSVRDSKGEFYSPPFYQRTHGKAEQAFQDVYRDTKTQVHLYPEDFDLYFIGEFDEQTGQVRGLDTPQHIIKAVAFQNQTN